MKAQIERLDAALAEILAEIEPAKSQQSTPVDLDMSAPTVWTSTPARCRKCGSEKLGRIGGDDGYVGESAYGFLGLRAPTYARWPSSFCEVCRPDTLKGWEDRGNLLKQAAAACQQKMVAEQYQRDVATYQAKAEAHFTAAIGIGYSGCTFDSFHPSHPSHVPALDVVRRWATDVKYREQVPFVFLFGDWGIGKTHLAVAAWRQLTTTVCIPTFADESRTQTRWRMAHKAYGDHSSDCETPDDIVTSLTDTKILFWDDAGKTAPTEAWAKVLFQVMNDRMAMARPTLITSNYSPSILATRFDPSLVDRIMNGAVIEMGGESMRGVR